MGGGGEEVRKKLAECDNMSNLTFFSSSSSLLPLSESDSEPDSSASDGSGFL